MNIIQKYVTNNPCYKTNQSITVKGLMLHSVGCAQPSANVFINMWNKSSYNASCVHGIIDGNNGNVYQLLPWNKRGWHCGSGSKGSGNNTHIGVEMCEPADIKYTGGSSFNIGNKTKAQEVAKKTYESAVELFATLCKQYKLNPLADGVIISHAEGYKRGIASNHGDPEHLWRGLGLNYTMNTFRQDVNKKVNGETSSVSNSATETACKKAIEVIADNLYIRDIPSTNGKNLGTMKKGKYAIVAIDSTKKWGKLADDTWIYIANSESVKDANTFKVRVTASALNIRSGASTSYKLTGCIKDKGTYTVFNTINNWGAILEYNGGWICLDYTTRI